MSCDKRPHSKILHWLQYGNEKSGISVRQSVSPQRLFKERRFLGKCSVCTQAYAARFKDAWRPCWGEDGGSVPIQACQCPRGCGLTGETGGWGAGGRAQLPPQIEELEPGQRRPKTWVPLCLYTLSLSLSPTCTHTRTPLQCECLLVAHGAVTLYRP